MRKRITALLLAVVLLLTAARGIPTAGAATVGGTQSRRLTEVKVYDEAGELTREHVFSYDSSGKLTEVADHSYGEYAYESHVTFTYDEAGRLLSRISGDPDTPGMNSGQEYTYNDRGQLVRTYFWEGGAGESLYEYDSEGNLIRETDIFDFSSTVTEFEYGENGLLEKAVSVTTEEWSSESWQEICFYAYDSQGRLAEITWTGDNSDSSTTYDYSYRPFIISRHTSGDYSTANVVLEDESGNLLYSFYFTEPTFQRDDSGYLASATDIRAFRDQKEIITYEFCYDGEPAKPEETEKPAESPSGWSEIYYDFIVQDKENSEFSSDWEWVEYQLIRLDGDAVPELWIDYQINACGCRLAAISNGEVRSEILGAGGLSYMEGENVFHHSYGHQGIYGDTIYQIENGSLITLSEGSYNTYNMEYTWNGQEVTEQAYTQKINAFVEPSTGKSTSSDENKRYSYEEILEYLSSAATEKSTLVPPEDFVELKAYTAFPESTIGVGQKVKIMFTLYVNGEQASITDYVLGINQPSVIESTEAEDSGGSRIITFKGLNPGFSDLIFTEVSTGETITLSVAVENQCSYFRCSAFPIPEASSGGIYVANYSCTADENGNHDIKFDAYNTSYSYGVVAVYNEKGSLIRVTPLDPRSDGSGMEKVFNGFKWAWEDISNIFNEDIAFYEKGGNAEHTVVELENIPENAEIVITSDGNVSDFITLYTGVDVFVRTVCAASSIDLKKEGQIKTVEELMDALIKSLIKSVSYKETEEVINQGLIKEAAESISTSIAFISSDGSLADIYQTVYNLFQSLDIDAEGIMCSVLKGMGYGVADAVFTTLVPMYKIVNFVDLILETAWPLVDYQFNLDRGKMEIHIGQHGLQNFVANSVVTVTQKESFSRSTVLDAYEVLETDELDTLSASIPSEMTNYAIYNITLRDEGVEVQPSGEIEVRLPVPDGADGEKCVVCRIEENGERTLLPSSYNSGYLTFTTTHLSYYIVGQTADAQDVDAQAPVTTDDPVPFDSGAVIAVGILIVLAAVGVVIVILTRKKKN